MDLIDYTHAQITVLLSVTSVDEIRPGTEKLNHDKDPFYWRELILIPT